MQTQEQNSPVKSNIYSIVLCGGSGTRLWPLSRKTKPKQFISLNNTEETLLQSSLNRVKNISPKDKRWIVLSEDYLPLVKEQCEHLISNTILEPEARNTAPAVALAAWELMKIDPESIMVILSSDHSIQNVRSFEQTIMDAVILAEQDQFVTVGIQPTYPSTSFGYVECGLPLNMYGKIVPSNIMHNSPSEAIGFSVRSFREKPGLKVAEQFIRTGKYLWNAGIFVWKTRTFWEAFSHIQPEMARLLETSTPECLAEHYNKMEALPIDIAFMEQTSHVACVPAAFDWSDVGSWAAVRDSFEQDENGNFIKGDVMIEECKNCLVSTTGTFVATIGVENIGVIVTKDAVLVLPLERSQEVKKVVNWLEEHNRKELL